MSLQGSLYDSQLIIVNFTTFLHICIFLLNQMHENHIAMFLPFSSIDIHPMPNVQGSLLCMKINGSLAGFILNELTLLDQSHLIRISFWWPQTITWSSLSFLGIFQILGRYVTLGFMALIYMNEERVLFGFQKHSQDLSDVWSYYFHMKNYPTFFPCFCKQWICASVQLKHKELQKTCQMLWMTFAVRIQQTFSSTSICEALLVSWTLY